MSSSSARILSVSDYESLRASRELLLKSAGYSVISMSSDRVLTEEIAGKVEIAIVDQTTNDSTATQIAGRLRDSHANIRILRLTELRSPNSGFDAICAVELGPEVFLNRVAKLAKAAKFKDSSVAKV